MMRSLILALFLVGCGPNTPELCGGKAPESCLDMVNRPHSKTISTDGFDGYVKIFQEQAAAYGYKVQIDDLVIGFAHIAPDDDEETVTLGTCSLGENTSPTIVIDPAHWKDLSMVRRHLLLFHELGHCILKRDHIEDYKSVMNPILITNKEFVATEKSYLSELFDKSKYGTFSLGEIDNGHYHSRCGHLRDGVSSGLGD